MLNLFDPFLQLIFGQSSSIRPSLKNYPIFHPFIDVGKCLGASKVLPFTVSLTKNEDVLTSITVFQTINEGRLFKLGRGKSYIDGHLADLVFVFYKY